MGLYDLACAAGPTLGPIVAGFAVVANGWRWAFWEMLWITGFALVVLSFSMPEVGFSSDFLLFFPVFLFCHVRYAGHMKACLDQVRILYIPLNINHAKPCPLPVYFTSHYLAIFHCPPLSRSLIAKGIDYTLN
jgi:MFS family permease